MNWTRAKLARNMKRQSLQNALLVTVLGDHEKAAIWCLDECDVGSQTIRLQAILAQMRCDDVLGWVGEEILKGYKNLTHNRGLQVGDCSVRQVGAGSDGEAVMDLAGAEGGEGLDNDDDEDQLRPPSVPLWRTTCTKEATGEARGSFSRVRRGGKRRSPAEWLISHCPLGCSSELILRAASSATGRAPPSNTTTGRAGSTRPTQRRTRRRTGPSGGVQGGALQVDDGRDRTREGDSGDQESLGS